MFRQVMDDLNYVGEEPIWEMMDFAGGVNSKDAGLSEQERLFNEMQRLKKEKVSLATELQKT